MDYPIRVVLRARPSDDELPSPPLSSTYFVLVRAMVVREQFARSSLFYGGLGRKVLADRFLFVSFGCAAMLQAVGHATTALAAGFLGGSLSVDPHLISPTFRWVSNSATLAIVGVAATLIKGAGATVGATLQSRLAQNVASEARARVASQLLSGGSPLPTGQLSARLTVSVRELEVGVQEGFLGGIRAALTLVPLAVALYALSSVLALGALLVLAPFALATALARRAWRRSHARALSLAEGLDQEVDELVVHIDVSADLRRGSACHSCFIRPKSFCHQLRNVLLEKKLGRSIRMVHLINHGNAEDPDRHGAGRRVV